MIAINDKVVTKSYNIIKSLIDEDLGLSCSHDMGRESYLREYRTISIVLPRQHSNTSLAAKIYKFMPNDTLFVTVSSSHEKIFKEMIGKEHANTCSYTNMGHTKGKNFKVIVIDSSSIIKKAGWNNIYRHAIDVGCDMIVKLG